MVMRASAALTIGLVALVASDARAQLMTPSALGNLLATGVQQHYASAASWSAKVDEHYLAKAYNQTKDATGTAVSSASPRGTNVTFGGQTTFIPCSAPSAFFFLCGSSGYAPFTFQGFSGGRMNFPTGDVLVATPVLATPAFVKILLYVDTTTFDVRRATVIDGQGNRNSYDFH